MRPRLLLFHSASACPSPAALRARRACTCRRASSAPRVRARAQVEQAELAAARERGAELESELAGAKAALSMSERRGESLTHALEAAGHQVRTRGRQAEARKSGPGGVAVPPCA